ncbi:MAG: PD-(D/E)XK nuclease family transposase [Polyangiaceae bacterium]|nr:PD-(D/E)XK nuclease family transposase [Polyangiaceae bacterium]
MHDGTLLSDAFEVHTVELPKLGRARQIDPEDAAAHDWARFFAAETDEERKELAMRNQDIGKANQALERLSQDPAARDLARWREDQIRLYEMELGTAREEGREEGIRTAIEALCEVLGLELSPARRSVIVAMSASELTPLLESLKQHRRWPEH